MSWSVSFEALPAEASRVFAATLQDLQRKGPSYSAQYEPPEVQGALAAAMSAAKDLLPTVENPDAVVAYRFQFSGHSNPERKPRSGWANDYIQVTITQL